MKIILWDFDGTLAYREGMWSGTLSTLANQQYPEYNITRESISPSLQAGFPWHTPEKSYGERTAEKWWQDLEPVFYQAYLNAGVSPEHASTLSQEVRAEYTNVKYWTVYDDVSTALDYFRAKGWQHYILSNHVPELPMLVNALGLQKYIDKVFNSANIGFEKPHKAFFEHVQSELPKTEPQGHDTIWMVGDSYNADVLGAESAGIPAILVRNTHENAKLQCASLSELSGIIN